MVAVKDSDRGIIMDESYIRHTAVAQEDEARREIEPEHEEIQKSDVLDALDEVELDDTDGQSVRDLMKDEFDASDVLDRYDDWSAPLHDQAVQSEADAPASHDEQLIKSTGIARAAFDVDTDRPELDGLAEVKKTVEQTNATGMDDRRDIDNPAWDAVHRATEDARDQFVAFEKELDEVDAADETLPREYRLAKKMKREGEAADVPFGHLVDAARQMIGKDGRRVYISDAEAAPEGVSVHEGPQGGLYYEPNVEQPSATDTMDSPGNADRGEAVEPGNVQPVADAADDAFMGNLDMNGPGGDVPWETVDMTEEEIEPEFINQIIEAVTDVLHPEADPRPDRDDHIEPAPIADETADIARSEKADKAAAVEWAVYKVLKEYTDDDA